MGRRDGVASSTCAARASAGPALVRHAARRRSAPGECSSHKVPAPGHEDAAATATEGHVGAATAFLAAGEREDYVLAWVAPGQDQQEADHRRRKVGNSLDDPGEACEANTEKRDEAARNRARNSAPTDPGAHVIGTLTVRS